MNDPNKDKEPSVAGPVIILVPLMILCCAAPLIIASGALAGFFAWFSGSGATMIGLAVVAGAAGVVIYKTRFARSRDNTASDDTFRDR